MGDGAWSEVERVQLFRYGLLLFGVEVALSSKTENCYWIKRGAPLLCYAKLTPSTVLPVMRADDLVLVK